MSAYRDGPVRHVAEPVTVWMPWPVPDGIPWIIFCVAVALGQPLVWVVPCCAIVMGLLAFMGQGRIQIEPAENEFIVRSSRWFGGSRQVLPLDDVQEVVAYRPTAMESEQDSEMAAKWRLAVRMKDNAELDLHIDVSERQCRAVGRINRALDDVRGVQYRNLDP